METAFELIKRDSVITELKCFVCGMKTGCNECEYLTDCEQRTYSQILYMQGRPNTTNKEIAAKRLQYR
jgi:hypothetical protein